MEIETKRSKCDHPDCNYFFVENEHFFVHKKNFCDHNIHIMENPQKVYLISAEHFYSIMGFQNYLSHHDEYIELVKIKKRLELQIDGAACDNKTLKQAFLFWIEDLISCPLELNLFPKKETI